MWLYLAMHGTYSILWLIKGRTYPDRRFTEQVAIGPRVLGRAHDRVMPSLGQRVADHRGQPGGAAPLGTEAHQKHRLRSWPAVWAPVVM